MADNYQITYGIGTPASIQRFILFALATRLLGAVDLNLHERRFLDATLYKRLEKK